MKSNNVRGVYYVISLTFTVITIVCMLVVSLLIYANFTVSTKDTIVRENSEILKQISLNISLYTKTMMRISDTMYYNVIKKADISDINAGTLLHDLNLIYEGNTDSIVSIACFSSDGGLIAAAPNATLKDGIDVTSQEWFQLANTAVENIHFSTPHIENLYHDSSARYRWVISLSQSVEITKGSNTERGVLLVDMDYGAINQIFKQTVNGAGYTYLTDSSGEIIYHVFSNLINSGLKEENNRIASSYADGVHEETYNGENRIVIVKTAGYTGWKLISVIPESEFALGYRQMALYIFIVIMLTALTIIIINSLVSYRVSKPIKMLATSVEALETHDPDPNIYIGGPLEIRHLGLAIHGLVTRLRGLTDSIVYEQEEKRKSEFNALQAQINPHFLYNTLESIVWMIESNREKDAITMVMSLANFFRISLSRGANVIPLESELNHARYYLRIQNMRYKDKFEASFDIDPGINDNVSLKLIIQPLIENAIYHAMETMDGEGWLSIKGWRDGGDVYIEIRDNGPGMTKEMVDSLLDIKNTGTETKRKWQGMGIRNVNQRIKLYFGSEYGLEVESELDVGTCVRIHLPAKTINDYENEDYENEER